MRTALAAGPFLPGQQRFGRLKRDRCRVLQTTNHSNSGEELRMQRNMNEL